MYSFNIKIAGHVIGINTLHVRTKALCRDFIVEDTPEFSLYIEQKDIDAIKREFERVNGVCTLWEGALEFSAVQKKLSEHLLDLNVLMIHGASIACDNEAYIFSAPSGTGKTTHIKKWVEHLPDVTVINGDKPFLLIDNTPMVCGSPWAGKESLYSNQIVPLKAVILMERSDRNYFDKISLTEALPLLLQQVYLPKEPTKTRKALELLSRLSSSVSFYRYHFNNFSEDAFSVSYHVLHG